MKLSFIDGKGVQHYTEWPNCRSELENRYIDGKVYLDQIVVNADGFEIFRIPEGLVVHVITE